ncbi:MAG: prepilin-type N-terminal cleavage/methylation domain-containing protein [bacterium]|nr:prepilin-type N-terminal cleavage/methylation domain-containing protein [bacterium]
MLSRIKNNNKGFTIIEVLIVLAIAGLIMLIVFLAVPALQRNQRNNARNSDASRISAAVTECLANRNGLTASCDTQAEIAAGNTSQIATYGVGTASSLTSAAVSFGAAAGGCTADGTATAAGAGARSFSVLYQLESGGADITRCIAS